MVECWVSRANALPGSCAQGVHQLNAKDVAVVGRVCDAKQVHAAIAAAQSQLPDVTLKFSQSDTLPDSWYAVSSPQAHRWCAALNRARLCFSQRGRGRPDHARRSNHMRQHTPKVRLRSAGGVHGWQLRSAGGVHGWQHWVLTLRLRPLPPPSIHPAASRLPFMTWLQSCAT